jgi:hypothetical protein
MTLVVALPIHVQHHHSSGMVKFYFEIIDFSKLYVIIFILGVNIN